MGDECNCEKCSAKQVYAQGGVCWPLEIKEASGDGRVRAAQEHFIVVGERGIALRRKSAEL